MKKIAVALAVAALSAFGCAKASENLCLENAKCLEEEDPAAFCQDAKADADADCDEDCQKIKTACEGVSEALAQCTLDNGSCQDVGGVKFFGLEDAADCEAETEAVTTCVEDNA